MFTGAAQAQSPPGQPIQLEDLQVQRLEDGYYINASMQIEWPTAVDEVARQERYMRLSYQPLTRRWRLLVSSQPIGNTGLGVSLGRSFDSASEALSALGRINRWKVAELAQVEVDAKHRVDFSFRLDLTQLPRPLQLGILGESDWNLGVSRSLKLTSDAK